MTTKGHPRIPHYRKGASRRAGLGGSIAAFRDAVDLEDAAHAINSINARKRRDGIEQRRKERVSAVTLGGGDALAAWLRKDVP